ncbi:hypothetical protein SEUCBS139899_010524 [Sporothrix eucalyptigena]
MTDTNLTVAFIGCGHMGGAILEGLLDALVRNEHGASGADALFSKFVACTRTATSAAKLEKTLQSEHPHSAARVQVVHGQTVRYMADADVVVLGFKPFMAADVLRAPGVRQALEGKLTISLLAGLSARDVYTLIASDADDGRGEAGAEPASGPYVSKTVPNVAARYGQSMTILERTDDDATLLPPAQARLVEALFQPLGWVQWVPTGTLNTASMLMTAAMAALSVPLEGLLDGAVAEGLRRPEAMDRAVHSLQGLVAMLAHGTHPAVMRESISSPRGCIIQTLLTVEKAGTRAVFAQSLIDGVRHLEKTAKK